MQYVLGFLFAQDNKKVVLIEKDHPEWQAGHWNGIGGKYQESDLAPQACMIREFEEETGLKVPVWEFCLILHSGGHQVHIFRSFTDSSEVDKVKTNESETVQVFDLDSLPEKMIPMLLEDMHWPVSFIMNPQ